MTTTFVLVHGAWHGPWAWDRLTPLLHAAGAATVTPELPAGPLTGLHDHAQQVAAVLDALGSAGRPDRVVLAGHSYAGVVVREAADRRPGLVDQLLLIDGWAGQDGESVLDLAPPAFAQAVRAAAGDGFVPAPPPAAFGVTHSADAQWLAPRLRPHPLRAFTERSRLTGAVDRIPGAAVCCRPSAYPFAEFATRLGYPVLPLDGPHDVMLTDPAALARAILRLCDVGTSDPEAGD